MSDRLLKESDVLRAIDNRIKELSIDPQFVQKHGIIDVIGIKKHVLAIPSADRPQEWILCEERLPREQGQYLVTFPLCNGEPWVYILSFNKGKFYETDDEWGDVEYDDVTAWMPLPKPWKGADDE